MVLARVATSVFAPKLRAESRHGVARLDRIRRPDWQPLAVLFSPAFAAPWQPGNQRFRGPGTALTSATFLVAPRAWPGRAHICLHHGTSMLSTSNVAIQFGAKPLFEQVTVKFADGNRYGLIGANGCGKSTLMKILGGELEQSTGDVMLQAGMRLGKLNQNQFAYEDERVLNVVMQGHVEMWQAMRERDLIYANPEATDSEYMRAAELEGRFAEYGGYNAEARAASILLDAGIPQSLHDGPMREVAPGLKLRVLLAQALFSKPDVLLLDEPTNNLDIHSIGWLERVINDYDATMIIISHDRHFLNQVCTHIADLDFQKLQIYPGNYDDFMLASVQARQRVEASNAKAKDRISDLQEFVRRFSANASKARQATSRRKQLEKIKIEEIRPSSRQNPYIRFEQAKKLYRSAVNVEKLNFSYPGSDSKVLSNVNFMIEAGERVAIIGPNGIGKTTLVRCLAGELTPTSGQITWVENAQLGYMPQDPQAEFAERIDLFTWMSQWTGKADDEQITRATLGRLLFSGDETKKSVTVLSGGEKGRMIYGKLILTKPNVLLMDEPTNHMDMETIESLQIGLEKYPGTLIFVSHDREFVGGLATRIIELREDGGIADFNGSYDEYLKSQGTEV
jgi:ATPase subunit of ABC transporter with duplicated ATPase domains